MATSPRTEAQLERLARLRSAVRASSSYHEAVSRLAVIGETWEKAARVYRRLGLRIHDDLNSGPPYETRPNSQPPVEIVHDEPPETLPSLQIPVYCEEPATPAPQPAIGWTVEEPVERIIFVPDAHFPHVDRVAWGVMLAAARRFRPDTIVVLGDFVDCFTVSQHRKDPRRGTQLEDEIDSAKEGRAELDALGAKRKVFIQGNHETALYRYLCDRAPALLDSVHIEQLLGLPQNGWEFVKHGTSFRIGDLYVTHDVNGTAGANAHEKAARTHMRSCIVGHTHRIGYKVFGNTHGERFLALHVGWLGSPLEATYSHDAEKSANWAHGFGIGWKLASGRVIVQPVPIVDRAAVVDGAVVRMAG